MITFIICIIALYFLFIKADGLVTLLLLFGVCALPVLAWIGVRL